MASRTAPHRLAVPLALLAATPCKAARRPAAGEEQPAQGAAATAKSGKPPVVLVIAYWEREGLYLW